MASERRAPGWWGGAGLGAAAGFAAVELDLPAAVSYWGDRAPLVIAATVLGAALGATRLARLLGVAALALLLGWVVVVATPLTSAMARGLVREDPVRDTDAIFVLASRLQADGDPTTGAMSRLLGGLELLAEGRAPRLVVSEIPDNPSYAALARRWASSFGLEGEILAVGPVQSTRDEAVAVADLFEERGWRSVLLVTSPTHSRRASAAFERLGLEVVSRPSVETRYDVETLDRWDERATAFGALLHERLGLAVYRWRGWIG